MKKWIVIAAVTLVMSSAVHADTRAKHVAEQPQSEAAASDAASIPTVKVLGPVEVVNGDKAEDCQPGNLERRSSELCAQWKAADAAQSSVDLSKTSLFISFISLLLLVWTFYLTNKSTKAAVEAADAAKKSHNAERAWVVLSAKNVIFEEVQQFRDEVVTDVFDLVLTLKNAGVTPALQVEVSMAKSVLPRSAPVPIKIEASDTPAIIPLMETTEIRTFKPSFYEEDGAKLKGGDWVGYIHLMVRYRDVFSLAPQGHFSTMIAVEYVYEEDVHYPSVYEVKPATIV